MQLPFLVVHAALVWKVILVAFVALCVAAFLAIRYALVRAANRLEARDLDTNDEGVIRGTLRGGTASTLYVASTYGAPKQPSFHAGELVIETTDGEVALDGDIRVAAGSRVAARRWKLPSTTPEELAKLHRDSTDKTIATAVLHEVGPGDEVIAKGTLVREAGDRATDYRENATRRVLRGSIAIAARAPETKLVRPSLPILAAVIAVSAFAGYKTESLCGDSWYQTCRAGGDLELANGNACVMANAMPGGHDALATLLDQLDRKAAPSESTLQERITLARLVEDCRGSVERLQRLARPELVLEEARRCRDADAQEVALAELGRFEEAAAVPSPLAGGYREDVRGRILVLAGAWQPAAAYAEQRATELRTRPPEGDPDRRERNAIEVVTWQCIAALMQYYADAAPTAVARIRELSAGPHGEQCSPEIAEIGNDEERGRVLGGRFDLGTPWRAIELERQLAGLGMKNDGIPALLLQGSDSLGMAYGPAVWATRLAPPMPDTAPVELRFDDATHRLVIAVWMRDFAAAHRFADRAIELGRSEEAGYDAQFTSLFHPMIDLYTAKTPLEVPPPPVHDDPALDDSLASIWRFMTPRLAVRHGDPFKGTTFVVTREMEAALTAAQHGDGAALAGTLGDDGFTRPLDLIAVLPLIKTHREELVRALPWMPVASQIVDFRFPFGTAQYYAERRAMFELAGDTANAKRAEDVFERYAAAFDDHRRLVALALLDF